jgi:hypothetical protein
MLKISVHSSIQPIGPTVMKAAFRTANATLTQATQAGTSWVRNAASWVETMKAPAGRVGTQTIIA